MDTGSRVTSDGATSAPAGVFSSRTVSVTTWTSPLADATRKDVWLPVSRNWSGSGISSEGFDSAPANVVAISSAAAVGRARVDALPGSLRDSESTIVFTATCTPALAQCAGGAAPSGRKYG